MMKHIKPGSMVLTSVFFVSMVMLIVVAQWKSQEALQGIAAMRAVYLKQQYAAQALLNYGVQMGKKQYAALAGALEKQPSPLLLTFPRWPLGGDTYARGVVEITYKKAFTITAKLLDDRNKCLIAWSCCLEKEGPEKQERYVISSCKLLSV